MSTHNAPDVAGPGAALIADAVAPRGSALDLIRRYVATQESWSEHGQTCTECPCETCEEWFDRDSQLLAEAKAWLRHIDGADDGR